MPDKLWLQCDECAQKETVPDEVVTCQPCKKPVECYIRHYYSDAIFGAFKDCKDTKTRYVMASRCRYMQIDISKCVCGICIELRRQTYNPLDENHYVHVKGYGLRPQHVLNSDMQYVTHAGREWNKMYVEEKGMVSQAKMDFEYVSSEREVMLANTCVKLRNSLESLRYLMRISKTSILR